jgi:hypothetical protein
MWQDLIEMKMTRTNIKVGGTGFAFETWVSLAVRPAGTPTRSLEVTVCFGKERSGEICVKGRLPLPAEFRIGWLGFGSDEA